MENACRDSVPRLILISGADGQHGAKIRCRVIEKNARLTASLNADRG